MHEFPLLERKCVVQCGSIPTKLLFLSQNNKFYAMLESKTVKGFKVRCCSASYSKCSLRGEWEVDFLRGEFLQINCLFVILLIYMSSVKFRYPDYLYLAETQ